MMRKGFMIATILGVLSVLGGVAWASIPNSTTGIISGCYRTAAQGQQPAGSLIVIDTEVGQSCPSGYAPLNWNGQHVHHQWTRSASQITGAMSPDAEIEVRALCPLDEIALGGGYQNRDPQNLTVVIARDLVPHSPTDPRGYQVTVVAGPNGSQDSIGVRVDADCGTDPDS